jgi:hypothetical protein
VRIVRLVARGVGSTAGFDIEAVDDLRISVEELCAAMFEVSDGGPLELSFRLRDDGVEVEGRTPAAPAASVDAERFALSEQILKVACDGFSLDVDDGVAHFKLHKLG